VIAGWSIVFSVTDRPFASPSPVPRFRFCSAT
jgi:hypothetical protein